MKTTMGVHGFDDSETEGVLCTLTGDTKNLSLQLYELLQKDLNKMESSEVRIETEKNSCSFVLVPSSKESIQIKIAIYESYYDLFVKDEEVVIQQSITPLSRSFTFIQNHLKSTVKEVLVKSNNDEAVKSQITFYSGEEKINSVGSISIASYLLSSKNKETKEYAPWIG